MDYYQSRIGKHMINQSEASKANVLADIPLDKTTIPQHQLNIEDKVRSNLFPWSGQFSPQLVHRILSIYARDGNLVVDPFMGSGTVLAEAGMLGLPGFGAEINPAAFQMSQVYRLINIGIREREKVLSHVDQVLSQTFSHSPLFRHGLDNDNVAELKQALVQLWVDQEESLSKVLLATLVVLLDFYRPGLTRERILYTWKRLQKRIDTLPISNAPIKMANCDARKLLLPNAVADVVITSPPYINVFNYHQRYRASVEALGWDLLCVARSEMGANRKHRANRFLTVIQYCLDIAEALVELRRICKSSGRIVLIVGRESNVLRTRFFNSEIVTRLALESAGLKALSRQERVFKNKFGAMIYEDIIHLQAFAIATATEINARLIASEMLHAALLYAPDESQDDLEEAINRVNDVKASPLYKPDRTTLKEAR